MTQAAWDDDWINHCLNTGEAYFTNRASRAAEAKCRWCAHKEHGMRCGDCRCDSSFTCRDDSWRPVHQGINSVARQFSHDYGVDGYVAHLLCTTSHISYSQQLHIKYLLAGEASP